MVWGYRRCSCSRTRAARVSGVSLGRTGIFGLGYDGAAVVLFVNEVDADAGDTFTRCDYGGVDALAVHPLPAELGQQRGVDVQDVVAVSAQRPGAELSDHVPGQSDEFRNSVRGQGIGDGGVQSTPGRGG